MIPIIETVYFQALVLEINTGPIEYIGPAWPFP